MAKTWGVTLPLTGKLYVEVEAEDEEAAIEAALASNDVIIENIEEWEVVKEISRGNVFCGLQNRADAQLIDDGE